jgi:mRNA interferase RelE/StbE
MSWTIEVKPTAEKQYLRLDKRTRKRIREALHVLEREVNPFLNHDIRPLTGRLQGDYRLRVGDWRILITPDREKGTLYVYAILPREDAY